MVFKYVLIILILTIILIFILFTSYTEPQFMHLIELSETDYTSDNLINVKFNYLIRNNCTVKTTIKALQIVTSYAGNIEARSALRIAYPKDELEKLGVYRIFLLAALRIGTSDISQNALINENERYNDIVQGDFFEHYKNLTYKHVMGMQWAVKECKMKYIIKMDDDIIVNMYSLLDLIHSKGKFQLLGYVFRNMRPIRLKANKWYVKEEEYDRSDYPSFLSGWLYVLTRDAARRLVKASRSEKYFWIDDVYVTGVLRERANLSYSDIHEYFTTNPEYFECCMRDSVQCGFIVGPSGGDYNINIGFQKHSYKCRYSECENYTNGKTFRNSCVTRKKLPPIGKGFAKLDVIKL